MPPDALGGAICQLLIQVAIGSLIGAVFLRAAASWLESLEVPYWDAYGTVLVSSILSYVLLIVAGFSLAMADVDKETARTLLYALLPVGFVVSSAVFGARLKIPFGRACLVTLVTLLIGLGVNLVILVPFFLLTR